MRPAGRRERALCALEVSLDGLITDVRQVADIRALKLQPGKDIHAVGGASLVSMLMNEGLVGQLRLTVHPIVLGTGTALFKDVERRRRLELLETRPLTGGRVGLTYNLA